VVILGAGVAIGVALDRLWLRPNAVKRVERQKPWVRKGLTKQEWLLRKFRRELKLNPGQTKAIRTILGKMTREVRVVRDKARADVKVIRTQARADITRLLNPEQRQRYREMVARYKKRRAARRARRRGRSGTEAPSKPPTVKRSAPPAPGPGPGGGPPPRGVLRALDADRDGRISSDEIAAAPKALLTLDKNGDGQLTSDEVRRRRRRGRPGAGPRGSRHPAPDVDTLAGDAGAKPILALLKVLDGRGIGMMNVPRFDGRLLRLLTEAVGAKHVVEVGTSNGYSALWISLGLRRTGGRLTTLEIDPHRAGLARKHFQQAGVAGRITLVMGDAHQTVTQIKGPVDLVFLDADKTGYIDYLQKLLPKVRPGGLIVAHNMRRPRADPRYIKAITENPALETLFLHMDGPGVAVTLKKRPAAR
jgi:predicted O-methyltransferase YrrM